MAGVILMNQTSNVPTSPQPGVPSFVYDGSLLPSVPASVLQVVVSVLYTTFAFVVMGMGAFAVGAQQKLDLDLPPNAFLARLLWKHRALALGMLAFIPATFSLVHLYTSSLHNFNIYNATNIVFAAVLSYGAKYLSESMQQLVEESCHMDTLKAVYESLFMCAKRAESVLGCNGFSALRGVTSQLADKVTTSQTYTKSDVFAAPARQDAWRFWGNSTGLWLFSQDRTVRTYTGSTVVSHRIHQGLNAASFTAQDLSAHADEFITLMTERMATLMLRMSARPEIRDYKIICGTKKIKLGLLVECLLKLNFKRHALDIMCERYLCRRTPSLDADEATLSVLQDCMPALFGANAILVPSIAGLNEGAVNDLAGLAAVQVVACLQGAANPATLGCPVLGSFVAGVQTWRERTKPLPVAQQPLFATEPRPAAARDLLLAAEPVVAAAPGFAPGPWTGNNVRNALALWGVQVEWCTVWLAYMHMVLLGVDLLRAHINQPVLTAQANSHGTYESGFFSGIMGLDGMAEAAEKAAATPAAALQAPGAQDRLNAADVAAATAAQHADVVVRYANLAEQYRQAAAASARAAEAAASTVAAAAAMGNINAAAQYLDATTAAQAPARLAADGAVAAANNAAAARRFDFVEATVQEDEANGQNVLAAAAAPAAPAAIPAPPGFDARAACIKADAAASAASSDAERAQAAMDRAQAAAVAAAVAVTEANTARVAAAQQLRDARAADSRGAAAHAAAEELVLATAGSAATLLTVAASAGEAKLAKAAATAHTNGSTADNIAVAAAAMSGPCVSALRYTSIYSLTDMELCGAAAALATVMVAMEKPSLVGAGGGVAAASAPAAAAVARALSANPADMPACGFRWENPKLRPPDGGVSTDNVVLKYRAELVLSHHSIPALLQGVVCLPPTESVGSMQFWLAWVLMLMAAGAVVIATLVCRDGVTLAAAAGLWQSLWVAVMFGVLHRVPRPPFSIKEFLYALIHRSVKEGKKARVAFKEACRDIKDPHLNQILSGSERGFWLDVLGLVLLMLAFGGFLGTLIVAIRVEKDCAPGALAAKTCQNFTGTLTSIGLNGTCHTQV